MENVMNASFASEEVPIVNNLGNRQEGGDRSEDDALDNPTVPKSLDHIKICDKPYHCPFCQAAASTKLSRHLEIVHNRGGGG